MPVGVVSLGTVSTGSVDGPVATWVLVGESSSRVARIAPVAASAAMTSPRSTGQIQSPGYQGTRRCQW